LALGNTGHRAIRSDVESEIAIEREDLPDVGGHGERKLCLAALFETHAAVDEINDLSISGHLPIWQRIVRIAVLPNVPIRSFALHDDGAEYLDSRFPAQCGCGPVYGLPFRRLAVAERNRDNRQSWKYLRHSACSYKPANAPPAIVAALPVRRAPVQPAHRCAIPLIRLTASNKFSYVSA
jgi:hypothetical protein